MKKARKFIIIVKQNQVHAQDLLKKQTIWYKIEKTIDFCNKFSKIVNKWKYNIIAGLKIFFFTITSINKASNKMNIFLKKKSRIFLIFHNNCKVSQNIIPSYINKKFRYINIQNIILELFEIIKFNKKMQ